MIEGSVSEDFNLPVRINKDLEIAISAYYNSSGILFIPVKDLFDELKIVNKLNDNGLLLEGYINDKKNDYVIDCEKQEIAFQGKKVLLQKTDFFMENGTIYMNKEILKQIFGISIDFDYYSLSGKLSAAFGIPVVKLMQQENMRKNMQKQTGEITADATVSREYHLIKGGIVDWSLSTNQSQSGNGETRLTLGTGMELAGGETDIWLDYSNKYGFDRNRQRYYWRWVDNRSDFVRQLQVGRIGSKSIATLYAPVDGLMITNTPTTVRKALGNFMITDYTNPDWTVELYINNVLIDYTKADASGLYAFKVPATYGTTTVTLRFYGPNGEVRSEEKSFYMPYNQLPKGEFEYRTSGGYVLDSTYSRYGHVELNYGVNRWLTLSTGIEYLSSVSNHPEIPFFNIYVQPLERLLLTAEYAQWVRTKITADYNIPEHVTISLKYTNYDKNQKAIFGNYLEERNGGISFPLKIKKLNLYAYAYYNQYVFPNDWKSNMGNFVLSGYYGSYNANLSNYVSWTNHGNPFFYGNLATSIRLGRTANLRPSLQYNYTDRKLNYYQVSLENTISNNGYLSMYYQQNGRESYSVGLSIRYNFSFMNASLSTSVNNGKLQVSESSSGSLMFDRKSRFVQANNIASVGRGGITIEAFVDINFNGKHEKNEPYLHTLNVKCNGGKVVNIPADSAVHIVGLESFVDYTVTLGDNGFDYISWQMPKKIYKVRIDPNQFKRIIVPILPMGEVSGSVFSKENPEKGLSRIGICIYNEKGERIAKFRTESDGYFSFIGLPPGRYKATVDASQLTIIHKKAPVIPFTIRERLEGDVCDLGNIILENE